VRLASGVALEDTVRFQVLKRPPCRLRRVADLDPDQVGFHLVHVAAGQYSDHRQP
jgi:hypothetical protein